MERELPSRKELEAARQETTCHQVWLQVHDQERKFTMTDLRQQFNELLQGHQAPLTTETREILEQIDEFLKEAYRIVCLLQLP